MNHSCNNNSLFISSFAYVFVLEKIEIAMTFMLSKTKEIFRFSLQFAMLMERLWNGDFYVSSNIRDGIIFGSSDVVTNKGGK